MAEGFSIDWGGMVMQIVYFSWAITNILHLWWLLDQSKFPYARGRLTWIQLIFTLICLPAAIIGSACLIAIGMVITICEQPWVEWVSKMWHWLNQPVWKERESED